VGTPADGVFCAAPKSTSSEIAHRIPTGKELKEDVEPGVDSVVIQVKGVPRLDPEISHQVVTPTKVFK